jgi:hypothetical protein
MKHGCAWLPSSASGCPPEPGGQPDAGPSRDPLQLQVGIQREADNIGHAINAAFRSDPTSTVVLSHFWANAFNTIHRADLFAAVASRHPSLVRCAYFISCAQSTVRFFSDKESGTVDIASAHGGCQGDPFGPLLLALVPHLPFMLLLRTLQCTQLITPMTHTS